MAKKRAFKNYVEQSSPPDAPKSDVKQSLLAAGWPEDIINDYLHNLGRKFQAMEKLPSSALIMLNSVSKSFGDHEILRDISMEIRPGEIFGIIGLSGTGKTTLLNMLVGFIEPDSGDVIFKLSGGSVTTVKQSPQLVKTLFGFSTQAPSFYSKLTVKENLLHFGALYGIDAAKLSQRADDLLALVELSDSKDIIAQNLSGGMQKRLDIACAMVHNPKVLILDEPTADLDPLLRRQMWSLIKKINSRGTTIIVASHFVGEIEKFCSRIAVLSNQTISKIGTVDELVDTASKNYILAIQTKSKKYDSVLSGIKKLKSVTGHELHGDRLLLSTKDPKKTMSWLSDYVDKNNEKIVKLNLSRPSLSDLFEGMVKK